MNPLDIHLKFTTQAIAEKLFLETGVWLKSMAENGVTYYDAPGYLTDVIGLIYKPVEATTDVGGWHVNFRGQLPAEIEQYKITVTGIPHRIWD